MKNIKDILKLTGIPVLFASMCCLSPIILLLFGFGTVATMSSLADTLYGDYKWVFRSLGLILIIISLVLYFRKKGICTLDKLKRERNKVINTTLIVLFSSVLLYIFFLYVVVHYIGVFLNVWD